ncbi:MAG: mannose-6-phosphate isomerase [Planctomycetes bacterium]|jgi:mannose-6-phosphate isomerase|nr:mannose-6-phosphate isomerase [Planctomycetota bacterium]
MGTPIEPLLFERHFVEKVWGGRALEQRLGIALPGSAPIGETWEIVDRQEENSKVAAGAFKGRTLRELMEEYSSEILGSSPTGKAGRFPLLVKYVDAGENLSVQVHPDEAAAARLGDPAEAKTEAWYVVDAIAEGVLYCGLRRNVGRDEFARVANGSGVVETLSRWDVQPGQCMLVPGGTVHAIGAGVTILEVQENSDTTYRLWDWGRKGRETHVPQALESIHFGKEIRGPATADWEKADVRGEGFRLLTLVCSDFFVMSALRIEGACRRSTEERFRIYAVSHGSGWLGVEGRDEEWALGTGDVWLVPADCGYHRLRPGRSGLNLIEMHTP